ncbi:MAG: TolC family protein [Verrucomicrobia bacterium]|nr:TolC family protein [Verrucomicrobiota bacterium]
MKIACHNTIFTILVCLIGTHGIRLIAQETTEIVPWPAPEYEDSTSYTMKDHPTLSDTATLRDVLTFAALNNPGLESAFKRWKAEGERIAQEEALAEPRLSYTYMIEEVETRAGPQKQRLELSQMFPWFGTRKLRGRVASEATDAAFQDYQSAKLKLFYEVKKTYYELHYLHRAIAVTDANIQLLKHLEGVARSKHRAGASQSEVIKVQIELGRVDDQLRTFQDMRGPISAMLNAAMNRPLAAPLAWPSQVPLDGAEINEQQILAQQSADNPELQAMSTMVRKEAAAVDLARKDFYPNIMLGVGVVDTAEARMPGSPDSGKDAIMAMIALELPVWRGKYKAGLNEARRNQEAAELALIDKSNMLGFDLKMALYRFRDAERKIDLYGGTLAPQAQQALNVTEETYRAGTEDFLSLIDAQRLLLEFQLAHERALADREIAIAEIEMLAGRPLTSQPNK